jgi:hypothetical protein
MRSAVFLSEMFDGIVAWSRRGAVGVVTVVLIGPLDVQCGGAALYELVSRAVPTAGDWGGSGAGRRGFRAIGLDVRVVSLSDAPEAIPLGAAVAVDPAVYVHVRAFGLESQLDGLLQGHSVVRPVDLL